MQILFAFLILCSCSDDDFLPDLVINGEGQYENQIGSYPPASTDSIPLYKIDTTRVSQADSTVVIQSDSLQIIQRDTSQIGLTDTLMVSAPENKSPIAVATANILSGIAPLIVDFSGDNSSDDNTIVYYNWDFPGNFSATSNTTHTFNEPGVYDITLTVTDEAGLQGSATLTVTVNQENLVGQISCSVGGGKADDTGHKVWCWEDITLPQYFGSKGESFSNGELVVDSECYEQQVTKAGNRIKFRVNPTTPEVGNWCSRNYNMRAEIRTAPWDVRHPKGTEEWFGWSYTFGDNYVKDATSEWLFHQVHNAIEGQTPLYELMVASTGQYGASAGEIVVKNNANNPDAVLTGVVPVAGQTINVVVHVIWDDASNGLLQVWIDNMNVYDKQVTTIRSGWNYGGNAKWGIYKWTWANESGVQASQQQGITHLETFMGNLRVITRRPGDTDYLKDSYALVAPDLN